jgi:hypothetical protein
VSLISCLVGLEAGEEQKLVQEFGFASREGERFTGFVVEGRDKY